MRRGEADLAYALYPYHTPVLVIVLSVSVHLSLVRLTSFILNRNKDSIAYTVTRYKRMHAHAFSFELDYLYTVL